MNSIKDLLRLNAKLQLLLLDYADDHSKANDLLEQASSLYTGIDKLVHDQAEEDALISQISKFHDDMSDVSFSAEQIPVEEEEIISEQVPVEEEDIVAELVPVQEDEISEEDVPVELEEQLESLPQKVSEKAAPMFLGSTSTNPNTKLIKAFTLNDRFRYRRELFKGNDEDFTDTLNLLADMDSYDEAADYLLNDMMWNPTDPAVKDFMAVLENNMPRQ